MPTVTKVRLLRAIGTIALGLFLVVAGVVTFAYVESLLTPQYLFLGYGGAAILVVTWFLTQRTLDTWLMNALNRTELGNDGTFDLLYNNSPVAYVTLDSSATLIDYNPAAVRLLETTLTALKGKPFVSLCSPDYDSFFVDAKIKAKLTLNKLELPLRTFTGKTIWVLLSSYALPRRGETLVTLVNITEQKRIDEAKTEFLALATHQLRTPIAAIRYASELLATHLPPHEQERNRGYVEKIQRNVARMIALINDFLNVSKLEMGTFATTIEPVNLTNFVTDILDEFNDRITGQGMHLARQDDPENLTIDTDPRLLNIALNNLVSNAVKYTPYEGRLSVSFAAHQDTVSIEVSDSGIGIPEAELPQLFKKFFRASNAALQKAEGTGLGLYIVKQAIAQLNGTVTVTSEVGVGTTFVITLPLRN